MAIQDSSIYADIMRTITNRSGTSDTKFRYTLEILVGSNSVPVKKVHVVDIGRDFVMRYSDYLVLTIATTVLEYDKLIYPNREDLLGQLTVQSVDSKTGTLGAEKATMLYRVKLTEVIDSGLKYGDSVGTNDSAKGQELKDYSVQLFNLDTERLRVKDISTVIRDTSVMDILGVVMSDYGALSVDIHPPAKTDKIGQLPVPDGTSLIDFPAWLQKYGGGVYSHNIGVYCLRGWVSVYPLYDTESYPSRRKLTICSIGPGQMEGLDNTYAVEAGKLSIVCAGEVTVVDETEKKEYNLGNAVRFNAPNLLADGLVHSNGVTTLNGSGYTIHGVNKETVNNSKVHKLITANPFYEVSRIASVRGVKVSLTWENANPGLIYPNMEVLLLYKTGDTVHSMTGILHGMDYQSTVGENEGTEASHQGNAVLHLHMDKTVY